MTFSFCTNRPRPQCFSQRTKLLENKLAIPALKTFIYCYLHTKRIKNDHIVVSFTYIIYGFVCKGSDFISFLIYFASGLLNGTAIFN